MLEFDGWPGVTLAPLIPGAGCTSETRPHLASHRLRHNRALPITLLSSKHEWNKTSTVYDDPTRTSSQSSESCTTFQELRVASCLLKMASAAGSDIFAIIALLCISLLVLLLLRHFLPLRSAPAYLVLPVFLSLALPASVILLVPIDLASSARVENEASKGIWLPERAVLVTWRIAYWLTFTLTWLVACKAPLPLNLLTS